MHFVLAAHEDQTEGSMRELGKPERRQRSQHTANAHKHTPLETHTQIEDGVRELVKAEKHQRSGRAMTCIIVLCVLIAIFLLITIVRHA